MHAALVQASFFVVAAARVHLAPITLYTAATASSVRFFTYVSLKHHTTPTRTLPISPSTFDYHYLVGLFVTTTMLTTVWT